MVCCFFFLTIIFLNLQIFLEIKIGDSNLKIDHQSQMTKQLISLTDIQQVLSDIEIASLKLQSQASIDFQHIVGHFKKELQVLSNSTIILCRKACESLVIFLLKLHNLSPKDNFSENQKLLLETVQDQTININLSHIRLMGNLIAHETKEVGVMDILACLFSTLSFIQTSFTKAKNRTKNRTKI